MRQGIADLQRLGVTDIICLEDVLRIDMVGLGGQIPNGFACFAGCGFVLFAPVAIGLCTVTAPRWSCF